MQHRTGFGDLGAFVTRPKPPVYLSGCGVSFVDGEIVAANATIVGHVENLRIESQSFLRLSKTG